jgi:hypothetical protein
VTADGALELSSEEDELPPEVPEDPLPDAVVSSDDPVWFSDEPVGSSDELVGLSDLSVVFPDDELVPFEDDADAAAWLPVEVDVVPIDPS